MRKRLFSILLSLAMVTGLLPTTAFAAESDATNSTDGQAVGNVYQVNNDTELVEAVNAAKSGDTIQLAAGKYTLYNKGAEVKNKDLTFVGAGTGETTWLIGPKVPDPQKFGTEYNSDYSFDVRGTEMKETVTFKNMTLQSGSVNYLGFAGTDNTVVENCVIEGKTFFWGYTSATFTNTTFECPSGDYALWTYSSPTMTFDSCTFNSSGKVINVYTDYGAGNHDIYVNFNDCTVKTTAHKKQALKINDKNMGDYRYIINISGNNKVDGIDPNGITCSRLFGFDEEAENSGRTIVYIEGEKVWEKGERTVEHNHDFTTGAYSNGKAEDSANKYTDGYKDNAFSTSYGNWNYDEETGKLTRTVTKTCDYCGDAEISEETKDLELDVSRSKTATALDSNDLSTVTLSLPSAEATLSSDVVFVLDTSDCVGDVMDQVSELVTQLKTAQEQSSADIKVGVVIFNGSAYTLFDGELIDATSAITKLEDLSQKATTEKEVLAYFGLNSNPDYLYKGSNLHAGLRAAQKLLDSDTSVAADRKYLVTITDGMTYYWNDDAENVYGVYSESFSYSMAQLLFYAWKTAFNVGDGYSLSGSSITDWDDYISNVRSRIDSDKDQYVVNVRQMMQELGKDVSGVREVPLTSVIKYISKNSATESAHGIEHSVIACLDTYQEMVSEGYQCYTLNPDYGTDTFPGLFTSKLNEMANKTAVDFTSIQNEILYAVGAGSVVEDKMGADFDFVPGSLKLTVGGKELASKADGNATYFGDSADNLSDNGCRFKVQYDPTNDAFAWTINENVSNFAPVQLSYQVKLVNRSTTAGTYTVPTNDYATLTPKNSAGHTGKVLEFNVPTVSYTVKGSSGGGGGGGNSKPVVIPDDVPGSLNGDDHYAYIVGYPDSTVRPQNGITRAEVATIFFRLLTDEVRSKNSTKTNNYSDVASTDWYNHAISTLSAMGIIKGDTHGKFNPNASITRAEFAAIAARFDDKANTTTADFSDIASHWAKDEISAAANNGWINGYTDGTFRPDNNITRAEAMTLVNRVLKRLPETAEDLHDDMIKWTDNSDTSKWYYLAVQEATNSHYYETKNTHYEKWTKLRETRDWTELEK